MSKRAPSSSGFRWITALGLVVLAACGSAGGDEPVRDQSTTGGKESPTSVAATSQPADLSALRESCSEGDFAACDALYFAADAGSEAEAFGATCGGRIETDLLCADALGAPLASTEQPAPESSNGPDLQAGIVRMRHVSVLDPQVANIEAFTVLVPDTWIFDGFIEWRHDTATLASVIVQTFDPSGAVGIESYFLEPNVSSAQTLIGLGQNWGGSIVRQEMSAVDYLVQVAIPSHRSGAVVVATQSIPEVATVVTDSISGVPGANTYADAARVRIQYEAGGTVFEEDFYTAIGYFDNGVTVNWVPTHLYSLWAPAGELDANTPLLQGIVSSADVSLLWGANYQAVFNLFLTGQYTAIRSAGELSLYIASTADEIAAIHRDAFEHQQATYDRVFDSYSQYVRGQDRYQLDGAAGPVLLPRANNICQERATAVPTVLLAPLSTPCPPGTDLLSPLPS